MNQEAFGIRFTKLRFVLKIAEDGILSMHKESEIRGGIGQMLLQQYCFRDRNCEQCGFTEACIVQNFMYAKGKIKPKYVTTGESEGYVLAAESKKRRYRKGEKLTFDLTLFGNTIAYLNPIIQAVYMYAAEGLGSSHTICELEKIYNRRNQEILVNGRVYYENYLIETLWDYVNERKEQLINPGKLRFSTPLTLKENNQFIDSFSIKAIANAAARRVFMLDCFEGITAEEKHFFENLPDIVSQTAEKASVRRFSRRKEQKIEMKGIKGELILTQIPDEMLDYLLAGEITHIGKNARFGFGKYQVCDY